MSLLKKIHKYVFFLIRLFDTRCAIFKKDARIPSSQVIKNLHLIPFSSKELVFFSKKNTKKKYI